MWLAPAFRHGPRPLTLSALRSLQTPTMASADFCARIPSPAGAGSHLGHTVRPPRVLRTHRHASACRICAAPFRASFGLWWV